MQAFFLQKNNIGIFDIYWEFFRFWATMQNNKRIKQTKILLNVEKKLKRSREIQALKCVEFLIIVAVDSLWLFVFQRKYLHSSKVYQPNFLLTKICFALIKKKHLVRYQSFGLWANLSTTEKVPFSLQHEIWGFLCIK